MSVIVAATRKIDDDKNWIFLTLTVDGDEVRTTSVNPWNQPGPPLDGQALTDWCNNREPIYQVEILKQMYLNADLSETAGDTELEKFTAWISNGCENPDGTVITKVPFINSHDLTGDMRARKLELINDEVNTYINKHYDTGTQQTFTAIYTQQSTTTAVKNYLDPVLAWISSVMTYYYTKKTAIQEATTITAAEVITWDFPTTFDSAKPDVSLSALMSM